VFALLALLVVVVAAAMVLAPLFRPRTRTHVHHAKIEHKCVSTIGGQTELKANPPKIRPAIICRSPIFH
jgi:hypothetical protein